MSYSDKVFNNDIKEESSHDSSNEYSKVEECNESKEQSFNRISPKYKIDLDHGFEKDLPKINSPQLVPDDCELSYHEIDESPVSKLSIKNDK